MKRVFLKPRFKGMQLHSLYNYLISNPPSGYEIISPPVTNTHSFTKLASKNRNYFYKQCMYYFGSLPYILKQISESTKNIKNFDLIYASQHVLTTEKNWIVDLEYANALSGYLDLRLSKNVISKKLSSKKCKCIMPWSDWSLKTLKNSFDCKNFSEKIKVVRYTVPPKNNIENKKDSKLKILFLGSINPANIASFEFKGIYETIEAFLELQNDYDNIELIIRSLIPTEFKKKLENNKDVKILEKPLSNQELERLFLTSDIFPHSGFEVLNLSVLEAMSYGLPVISTSLYNTPELIKNMKNGLLIELPNTELFHSKNGAPNDYSKEFFTSMRKNRPFMKNKLVELLKLLIENKKLRTEIGRQSRLTIEKGEFSITHRNDVLREIFEKAI